MSLPLIGELPLNVVWVNVPWDGVPFLTLREYDGFQILTFH